MQTAHTPGERLAYPSVGAVFALFKSPDYKGLIPPYVVLTQPQGRFSEEGFLGPQFKPFATGGDPNAARFEVEGVVARGITDDRQKTRRDLLEKLNTMGSAMAASPQLAASEEARKQAYELILGEGREVFDLSQEKAGTAGSLRPPHLRAGLPGGAADGRGGRPLHRHQLPRRLGHAQQPLPDHAPAMPATGPGPGHAAAGLEGPRPAGEHARLVLRRVRPDAQGRLAAALERRPQPLRQRLHRRWSPAADSRAATSSARPTRKPKRSRTGPSIRWTCWAASTSWPASTPTPSCRIRWARRPTCCRPPRKA